MKTIAFSGFPTLPGLLSSILMFKKIYVHEQNAVLGLVNRSLARFINKLYTATSTIKLVPKCLKNKVQFVGMPVRNEIAKLHSMNCKSSNNKIHLLVTGVVKELVHFLK